MSEKTDYNQFKDPELARMRHTAEHLLHDAARIVWPYIHLAMGPATDDGFYFDFEAINKDGENFKVNEDDFAALLEKMNWLKSLNLPLTAEEITIGQAREIFKNNPYKLDTIEKIHERQTTNSDEKITVYWTGDTSLINGDYAKLINGYYMDGEKFVSVDLCAGPHVDMTGQVGEMTLLSVAGAYWQGDENNTMLTRIYGTAFYSQNELDEYLHQKDEAKKRDHKILGPQLDLFTFSEKVGGGLPLWTPKGTLVRNLLDDYVWQLRRARGYEKVEIPHITKKDLYETSGHWDKFKDELFRINTREGHEFAMKPMNCPHHTQIFARKSHSYRELPQRYANTTTVYRDEQSGELSGLSRVRAITQDDAHVFCRKDQAKNEIMNIWDIIDEFYAAAGFDIYVRLSLSDPHHPENYLGDPADWAFAENQLREVARERGVSVVEAPGEAAFYAPKLDFMAKDSLGREWQVATNQLDVHMPNRFGLYCINERGEKEEIFMIHAAIMGSLERYLSILIEHFAGAFPLWLHPTQIKIIPVNDEVYAYAHEIHTKLREAGLRTEEDVRSETLSARIRDAQLERIPYMLIIGKKEVENRTVSVRLRTEEDRGAMDVDEFVAFVSKKNSSKSLDL